MKATSTLNAATSFLMLISSAMSRLFVVFFLSRTTLLRYHYFSDFPIYYFPIYFDTAILQLDTFLLYY